jgi:hypothetical protein
VKPLGRSPPSSPHHHRTVEALGELDRLVDARDQPDLRRARGERVGRRRERPQHVDHHDHATDPAHLGRGHEPRRRRQAEHEVRLGATIPGQLTRADHLARQPGRVDQRVQVVEVAGRAEEDQRTPARGESAFQLGDETAERGVALVRDGLLQQVRGTEPTERRIEHDQVEPTRDTVEHVAVQHLDPVADPVRLGVGRGRRQRDRVHVDGHHPCAGTRRQDRVHPRARAHVEHAVPGPHLGRDRTAEQLRHRRRWEHLLRHVQRQPQALDVVLAERTQVGHRGVVPLP